jgi:hypothetical protein
MQNGLVHQRGNAFDDRLFEQGPVAGDIDRSIEGEAAGEHGQPRKEVLLVGIE